MIRFGGAIVRLGCDGHHCDVHGDGSQHVEHAQNEKESPHHDGSAAKGTKMGMKIAKFKTIPALVNRPVFVKEEEHHAGCC